MYSSQPYVPGPDGRDLRIDLLRGFCVFAMVVDHIGGPSFLHALTGGNRFYTSAAEAFIFISGLVMGLVYRRLVMRDGLGPSLLRAIERAVTLYLLTVTLTLIFLPLSEALQLPWAQGVDFGDPISFVVSVLTLHRTYYLVDIPLLYALLLITSPLALTMLSQGRTEVVLGTSWIVWAAYQFFPEDVDAPWLISGNNLFYFSAWQVFFFTGLSLGWHHGTLTRLLANFPRRTGLGLSALGTAGFILLYRLSSQLPSLFPNEPERGRELQLFLTEFVFAKGDVRLGRVLASIVVFAFFYLLVTEFWGPVRRVVGWLLVPMGQSALYAYAAHVAVAVPAAFLLQALPALGNRFTSGLVQIAVVLLIWWLIRRQVLFVDPGQGWARYAWPATAALACLVLLPLDPTPGLPGVTVAAARADPYAARVARAFGTPVPGTPPRGEGTPVPLPRPSLRPGQPPARGGPSVSPYVGAIRGSLLNVRFFSPALNEDMPYFVYLPPGYQEEHRLYPTLYMLHGNSGSYEEWLAYGLVGRADRMIGSKEILPLVIVLPQGDFSYWINDLGEEHKWGDYLAQDLVRHISATYRVFPDTSRRAVGGLSMGGTGALLNAFWVPDAFAVVGAHSPSLPAEGEREFLGEGIDYEQRDPISAARIAPRSHLENLTIWIDVGANDRWLKRAGELRSALVRRAIDHEWHLFAGDHDGAYWSSHVVDYLRFYDAALNPDRQNWETLASAS